MEIPKTLDGTAAALGITDPDDIETLTITYHRRGAPTLVNVQRRPADAPAGMTAQGPRHETYVLD